MLRVGGRLQQYELGGHQKHPISLSGKSHISTLIVLYYEQSVQHDPQPVAPHTFQVGSHHDWIAGSPYSLFAYTAHVYLKCIFRNRDQGFTIIRPHLSKQQQQGNSVGE